MFEFKKPKNRLEEGGIAAEVKKPAPQCPSCKAALAPLELTVINKVCVKCGHHFRMEARARINMIFDEDTFIEWDADLVSTKEKVFPEYDKKYKAAKQTSGENEGVVCGKGMIKGCETAVFVMDYRFMMGSMGIIVGEKITRAFEHAAEEELPIIGFTVSGGARMQEGVLSLMQMAKTSAAVKRHSDLGLLYIVVLTDPTTGGVTASFAMQADIIIAEPKALICFAGPRVIEQTIKQKLPEGFQTAEFLLSKGFVDTIAHRSSQKEFLANLLKIHAETVS